MTSSSTDLLVVGQGLAGSLLAWELERRGYRTIVLDADRRGSSSMAAAGLITTVTGKRLVLQKRVHELLPVARDMYLELERQFGRPFLYPLPVLRLFADDAQRTAFARRREDPAYSGYLGPEASGNDLAGLDAPFGGCWIHRTGYLDTRPLLEALSGWLREDGRLIDTEVDPAALNVEPGGVRLHGISARKVIFCEGYRAIRNTRFAHLPWAGAKGEILELRLSTPSALPAAILNWGNWLAPRADGTFRLGATHSWEPLDEEPTQDARRHLLDDLARRIPGVKAQILRHTVGVRPATSTRLPLLGHRPGEPRILIFNGFGAKGGLLIPWHVRRMADHLCHGTPLPDAVDIARYG